MVSVFWRWPWSIRINLLYMLRNQFSIAWKWDVLSSYMNKLPAFQILQIIGTWLDDFSAAEFKKNPNRIPAIWNEVGIPLPMEVPEIGTKIRIPNQAHAWEPVKSMTKILLEDFDMCYHPPTETVGKVKTCKPETETGERNCYMGVHLYFLLQHFLIRVQERVWRRWWHPINGQGLAWDYTWPHGWCEIE